MINKDIIFIGIDSWNRPVFKTVDKQEIYGSTTTLFSYGDTPKRIIDYFKDNLGELEYFGTHFNCEPHGGLISNGKIVEHINFNIIG